MADDRLERVTDALMATYSPEIVALPGVREAARGQAEKWLALYDAAMAFPLPAKSRRKVRNGS